MTIIITGLFRTDRRGSKRSPVISMLTMPPLIPLLAARRDPSTQSVSGQLVCSLTGHLDTSYKVRVKDREGSFRGPSRSDSWNFSAESARKGIKYLNGPPKNFVI